VLIQRVFTALILLSAFLSTLFFASFTVFQWSMFIVFAIAAYEWSAMFAQAYQLSNKRVWACTLLFSGLLALGVYADVYRHPFYILFSACLWWVLATFLVILYPRKAQFWKTKSLYHLMFGLLTVIPPFFALLYLKASSTSENPYLGELLILAVILITASADTFAYFSGKKFGKTKLIPHVSPNKTVEGCVGGLIATVVLFNLYWYQIDSNSVLGLLLVSVTVLFSILGDLAESMFKRHAQIKDSGWILPGHGGVLDRVDSLTAALPIFTFILIIFGK
tara:strand:+ start:35002 stop:35835 length:834 start_codon:yes stop_codon:yes gene_type:complete